MITLTLLHPLKNTPVQNWTFTDESVIRIGRSDHNHVVLYSAVVSRSHVEVRRMGEGWEVVNLGANGTYVEGEQIHSLAVTDGMVIRLARSGPSMQISLNPQGSKPAAETQTPAPPPRPSEVHRTEPELAPPVTPAPSPRISPSLLQTQVPAWVCDHLPGRDVLSFCLNCGQPLEPRQTIANHQVLKTLMRSSLNVNYLVWLNGQSRVLKTLNAEWSDDPRAQAILEQEARILQGLNHWGIAHLHDYFWADKQPYLLREMVYGHDLEKLVAQKGRWSEPQVVWLMLRVCEIIDYLHSQSPPVLHQDIRPANIILRANPPEGQEVALVGLQGGVSTTLTGTQVGLPAYMAPEQQEGNPLPASDLYSLGPTLVYLLTGQQPSLFYKFADRELRLAVDTVPGISSGMATVVYNLTHPSWDRRYPDVKSVARALLNLNN